MDATTVRQLQIPTASLVKEYVAHFEQDKAAIDTDNALSKLFNLLPRNRAIEDVLLKVVSINSLLSTGILATYAVAKHVLALDIDEKIEQGLPEVVNQIASVQIGGKTRYNYSFATKFCSFHRPETYPKYDANTEALIWAYQKSCGFAQIQRADDLRDYPKYKAIVECFRNYFGLADFSFKQIDNFLWGYGRALEDSKTKPPARRTTRSP